MTATAQDTSLLGALALALVSGRVRVVDLTQTLTPEFPQIALPPEMGQCWPFRIEEISRYDERGPGWYWNNFSCGEHTGTHFDAPIHWISGRDLPHNSVDTIPVQQFVALACVIDCSAQAQADPDYLLTVDDIERWEAQHGRIPAGAWVLMRTDWSKRTDPEAYQNFDETGQHTPGPGSEAVQFLVEQRDVLGFGSEAIGTDAGQGFHLRPPYPCHYFMHGAGRHGLQCLTNLDLLPPTGAILICPPLKIQKGSGSPLRVLALVEDKGVNRVAVVTGGSAGIGKAICERLLAQGCDVVSLARRRGDIDHPRLHPIEVDLTDRAATAEAARDVARRFEVTTVVHNAGVIRPALLADVKLADLDALVELHLACAVQLVQAALPAMKAQRYGRVVLLSSRAAVGLQTRTAYSATKAGMLGMARTWALELAPEGITVNVVAPGPIRTDMFYDVVDKGSEKERQLAASIPVRRLGLADDVARAVSFFVDPDNGFVTGQVLYVCGGTSVGSLTL